jgi:hypothetical protein
MSNGPVRLPTAAGSAVSAGVSLPGVALTSPSCPVHSAPQVATLAPG